MRLWTENGTVEMLYPNVTNQESAGGGYEKLQPRTITFQGYGNNYDFIYMAVRRVDGYVGKPAEAGTDSFAMDVGNGSSTIPCFDSGFPVDFSTFRETPAGGSWFTGGRVLGAQIVYANLTNTESTLNSQLWDSNEGFQTSQPSGYQAWMWKRGQGFDVSTYKGNDVNNRQIPHSLSKTPEMIWTKNTDVAEDWAVYHKDLTSGNFLRLNGPNPEGYNNAVYEGNPAVAPTSTCWQIGDSDMVNDNNRDYISLLFASVEGISKCGSYTGSSSDVTEPLGFTPRFILIKRTDVAGNWALFDTLRGIVSAVTGNGEQLYTHTQSTQQTYTWTCPAGVTSVSVVAVGGGGGGKGPDSSHNYGIGGGGGGLGYKNNISVTPGQLYEVKVGGKGNPGPNPGADPTSQSPNKGDSYFLNANTVRGGGGEGADTSNLGGRGGDYTGDGGGNGGRGGDSVQAGGGKGGGGGAGGYAGNGGNGINPGNDGSSGTSGQGGGGGGSFAGGGGVGLNGQGTDGAYSWNGGKGGSGGANGAGYTAGGVGGDYGGGGGCVDNGAGNGSYGGAGAVRIIWNTSGTTRSFPSTNVGPPVDKLLVLNDNWEQSEQDCVGIDDTNMILTGGDSEVNVNGGKYIYYAHA